MEADELNFNPTPGKLIVCTPCDFDDTISNAYTRALKQILDKQVPTNVIAFILFNKYTSSFK